MNELITVENQMMQAQDPDQLERLLTIRQALQAEDARKAFQRDFVRLQAVLPSVYKSGRACFQTKKGGRLEYSFVKIDDLTNALKPFMIEHGFSFSFRQKEIHDRICVGCIVMHVEGHRESVEMTSPVDTTGNKNYLQALASTISYLRRLTFTSAFGISVTDTPKAPPAKKYYADSAFKTNFPIWRLQVRTGKKTPQQLLNFLESKGVNLSDQQKNQVMLCGA